MAAATFYNSTKFTSLGMPLNGVVQTTPFGEDSEWVYHTLAAAEFNEVNDKVVLFAVPAQGFHYLSEILVSWDRIDSNASPTSAAKIRLEDVSQGAAAYTPVDLVTLSATQLGAAAAQPTFLSYPVNQVLPVTRVGFNVITVIFTAAPATATSSPVLRVKALWKAAHP